MSAAFSIVVPTWQRPGALGRMLESLVQLEVPPGGFEVVVVDDGSEVAYDEVIAAFADRLQLTMIRVAHCGPAGARQAGIDRASGRWLAFTDDDCLPARDWLAAFARAFEREPDCGFGGRVVNPLTRNYFAEASQQIVSFLCAGGAEGFPRFFTTNNLAFPRESLQEIGGIDRHWSIFGGEDRDLCARWSKHHPLRYLPEAVVLHEHALTFRTFVRQQFQYGRGAWRFRRQRNGEPALALAPLHTYGRLLLSGWTRERAVPARIAVTWLIVLAHVANAAGFAFEAFRG